MQDEVSVTGVWRSEPVGAEKPWDDVRIGAKDLSNWVIAGSLRNAFRGSLGKATEGGREAPKWDSVTKDVRFHKQPGCWLRGSHHLNSA